MKAETLPPPALPTAPRPTGAPLIELRNVSRSYLRGEVETRALDDIDLTIYPGEFVAIVGASGSGKSTLMNLLGCLDRPSSGSYRLLGREVGEMTRDQLAALRREVFGFVFQSYHLLAGANARENVEVPAIYAGLAPEARHQRATDLLTRLGLGDRLEHRPSQLSGGQQQRVSIARALMNGGRVLLADEPTGALDSHSGAEVMQLLQQLAAEGHTILLITHARELAAAAQRVIEMRDGRIVSDSGTRPAPEAQERAALVAPEVAPEVETEVAAEAGVHPASPTLPHDPGYSLSELLEATRTAVRALTGNLFRSALTLLGIVIGVASVIAMLAIGDGARQSVIERISAMGTNLLTVRPGAPNQRGRDLSASLSLEDLQAIAGQPNILAAVPDQGGTVTARYASADHRTSITGTAAGFVVARDWAVAHGSFFNADDELRHATVAVLGQTVATALFGPADPLGKYIMLNNVLFQVIGVMSPKGATPWGADQDDVIFVPFSTASLRLTGQRFLRSMVIAVEDVSRIDDTQEQIRLALIARKGEENFQIRNMDSIIQTVSETQQTLTLLLGTVAAISLLVGGIGVMNIMLVSVSERTREIGIRMATGARERNILQQFLIEALTVSALGGLIGVGCGLGAAALIASFGTPIQYAFAPVALAFSCAFLTGLIFGYLPARKAARLDPVTALASE